MKIPSYPIFGNSFVATKTPIPTGGICLFSLKIINSFLKSSIYLGEIQIPQVLKKEEKKLTERPRNLTESS